MQKKNDPEDRFNYALRLFSLLAKRDFLRAAAFLWIRPLVAALSNFLDAATKTSLAFASLLAIATSACFTAVRIADLAVALLALFCSEVATRLIADLMLGIPVSPPIFRNRDLQYKTRLLKFH